MSDIGPYGVTQHADAAMVTADQLAGTRIESTRENASTPGVGPALHSTAPYVPPKVVPPNYDESRATRACARDDCNGIAKRGSDYCRWHA